LLDQLINAPFAKELITVLMAMLPIAELRLAIPVSITVFEMPWYQVFYLAIIGNIVPVPFLLLFFGAVSRLLQKTRPGKSFIIWLMARTTRRSRRVEKSKPIVLALFVAIPLPFTGAWTASLIAYVLGVKFWPAFLSIVAGVLAAAVIVTVLTVLGWIGAGIAIAALVVIVAIGFWRAVV